MPRPKHMHKGIGTRKAQEERQAGDNKYRLSGVEKGSIVAECLDRLRRWSYGHRLGVLVRNGSHTVHVWWEGDEEPTQYSAGDARYKVDTNLWRISQPRRGSVFDLMGGSSDIDPLLALTARAERHSIYSSPLTEGDTTEEAVMPRKTKKQLEAEIAAAAEAPETDLELDDELDDEPTPHIDTDPATIEPEGDVPADPELDDELDDELESETQVVMDSVSDAQAELLDEIVDEAKAEEPAEEAGATFSAKQVATRIGTDAKTFRKFLRATNQAVGQGGRYEFPQSDLERLKTEFAAYSNGKTPRAAKPATEDGADKPKRTRASKKNEGEGGEFFKTETTTQRSRRGFEAPVIEEDDEVLELDDELEPSPTDLDEIEDIELDDEELD